MLGSPVLGTAVGLVVLFATTALLCSGITESISKVFQMRAKYLLTGMRAMLDDPEGGGAGRPNALRRWWAYLQAGLAARRDQRRRARTEPAEAAKAAVKKAVEEAVEAAKTGTAMAPEVAAATAVEAAAKQAVKAASRQERIAAAAELRQPTLDVHDRVKDPEQTKKAVEEVRARMAGTSTSTSTTIKEPMTTALWNSPLLRSLQSQRINGVGAV